MSWRPQINDRGVIVSFRNPDTGEAISAREYERRMQMMQGGYTPGYVQPSITAGGVYVNTPPSAYPAQTGMSPSAGYTDGYPSIAGPASANQTYTGGYQGRIPSGRRAIVNPDGAYNGLPSQVSQTAVPIQPAAPIAPESMTPSPLPSVTVAGSASPPFTSSNPLIQPGAQILSSAPTAPAESVSAPSTTDNSSNVASSNASSQSSDDAQSAKPGVQVKNLRLEGVSEHSEAPHAAYRPHGFLDATSIAIVLPTLILIALSIAAAHKKRLFPWQTIRTFSPPSGLMSPREYEKSFLCPPNLRRHGRLGKRNPNATWTDADGVVLPFGFLARTHLPITIPLGRLPNKNMFIVAPTGSGKTTLMRAIIKALMAKPCVIIALEAKANDPHLDEKKEGFKYTLLPEARAAGFDTLYFNPLDTEESIHWNPLDVAPLVFASSIVQDINRLAPEEQHWAERDHGYISGLTQLLKWGAVQVAGEDEEGFVSEVTPLPCNPHGLMRLVNNRRNIVESLRRLKDNTEVDPAELSELTQTLSSIIRTDTDWDKNIQGVRGRLRMFKNQSVIGVTQQSNVDIQAAMHKPTVLIFGAPASLGPDAESLAGCFVYQLQQALHTRYGIASILPLFAFFDEYQTLNLDIAGRLSAIVRGANGGLAVILQNISQITSGGSFKDPTGSGASELRTIFSNAAVRICLHNADESTSRFFSDEIGKHAVIVPGISDHFKSSFGVFPVSWNRIHSQQVVPRVDPDSVKRMEKHHGLVYLSPAGDPEYGEVKPFMVDLRGIEEIARLHLLYSIPGRRAPGPGSPEGAVPPPPPTHIPWQAVGQTGWAAAALENAAQTAGTPHAAQSVPSGQGQVVGSTTGGGAGVDMSSADFSASAVGKLADTLANALPGVTGGSAPTISEAVGSILTSGQPQSQLAQSARLCPSCMQPAANKKFCTNCGTFLGEPVAATTQSGTDASTSAAVPSSANALIGMPRNASRSPVTKPAIPPPFPFASGAGASVVGTPAGAISRAEAGAGTAVAPAPISADEQSPLASTEKSAWAGVQSSAQDTSDDAIFNQPLPRPTRQTYGYSPEDHTQTNPAPRKPVISLNPDLNRPIPKQ